MICISPSSYPHNLRQLHHQLFAGAYTTICRRVIHYLGVQT